MKRMPFVLIVLATLVPLTTVAQTQRAPFTAVTDAMLEKPDPGNWPMWRRTLDSWGFSPLDQVNRSNVNQLRMVWSRGMGPGNVQEATPLVYNGVMYVPNPERLHLRPRGRHGQVAVGIPSRDPLRSRKVPAVLLDQPQPGDLRHDDHRHERGRLRVRTRRADRQARVGNKDPRLPQGSATELGADHRQRQGHLGPRLRAGRRSGCLRDYRSRRAHRQGTLAHGARFRRRANRATRHGADVPFERRYHVGTWMVPSYDPELNLIYIGTSVSSPAPEVPARRERQEAPVPQLDAGARMPTPARSSGTTSTSSITGTSIILSSASSSIPSLRLTRKKSRGSTRDSSRERNGKC